MKVLNKICMETSGFKRKRYLNYAHTFNYQTIT
jgi:hypothetical protein